MSELYTFDSFRPGSILGSVTQEIDAGMIDRWLRISSYGLAGTGEELPRSIFQALFMNAYLSTVLPRPPGNVQASQKLAIHHSPRLDDEIVTTVTCEGKEMRKDRPYIWIRARGHRGTELMFDGVLCVIWAC